MPKNRSVITWRTIWLLLFTTSIPPQFNLVCYSLTVYNLKSFKSNGLASLFRKKALVTLRAFIKTPYLAQWLDPPLVTLFFKIFLLMAKTNLLPLPSLRAIIPLPYHIAPFALLFRLWFLFCLLWLNTRRMTFNGSSKPFWILDLLFLFWLLHLNNIKALIRSLWRPGSRTYIRVKLIWSAIMSSNSMKTILPPPGPRVKIRCYLSPPSLRIPPCFACNNTSKRWRMRPISPSPKKNSRPSFIKAWVSPRPLLTLFGALFRRSPSIS